MNVNNSDSPDATLAGGFKVAAAPIVIALVMAAGKATNDEVSAVTQRDSTASAVAATATNYFPSPYVLGAAEATPHIETF